MPDEHSALPGQATAGDAGTEHPATAAIPPPREALHQDDDEWLEEPEELPRRPRRRLFTPLPLALLGVLLTACGFIGGVLVQKGQSSSSPAASGSFASRFAALRGATSPGGTATGTGGGASGSGQGFTRPTAGTVSYLDGSTLYVASAEGNTIKVLTSSATTVNKTVKSAVKDIRPGETVTVRGATGSGGSVNAETVTVGGSGSGLAGLFGSASSGSASGSASGSGAAAGGQSLFGGG